MCLSISRYHLNTFGGEPAVVRKPILVWKWLCSRGKVYARSPYRMYRYKFGKMYSLRHALEVRTDYNRTSAGAVYEGFHAYYDLALAAGAGEELYPAVIPAGAEVYFGEFGEIVSTKLVVFRNMADLRKSYPGSHLNTQTARSRVSEKK